MSKFYVRVPKCTDADGTYARVLFPTNATVEITDRDIQILNNSAVMVVTQSKDENVEMELKVKSTGEHLKIKLPNIPTETLTWVWLSQPRYKPGDTIKGFVVIRDRVNKYMTALRKNQKTGFLALRTSLGTTKHMTPINFESMVIPFEIPTKEQFDTGNYTIVILDDTKKDLATIDIELAHFQKKEVAVQIAAPSWIQTDDVVEVLVTASYYHGDPILDGTATLYIDEQKHSDQVFTDGCVNFLLDNLKVGTHKLSVNVSTGTFTEKKAIDLVVSDVVGIIKTYKHDKIYHTQMPVTIPISIRDPMDAPIPNQPVVIKWRFLGKLNPRDLPDQTVIKYTDSYGKIDLIKTFDLDGEYEYTITTDLGHETVTATNTLHVARIVQGYFKIDHQLETTNVKEGEIIHGKITLRGHTDTVSKITFGFADLITDRIVETKRIELVNGEAKYTFNGVTNFYGTFAVDFYIPTTSFDIDFLSSLNRDDANCVLERVEGSIEPPYPVSVQLLPQLPTAVTTGSTITLDVKIDGELITENFHVFGALVDQRVLVDHTDSTLRQTFMKKPHAMEIDIKKSEKPIPPATLHQFHTMYSSSMRGPPGSPPPGGMYRSYCCAGAAPQSSNHYFTGLSYDDDEYTPRNSKSIRGNVMDELKSIFTKGSTTKEVAKQIQKIIRTNFAESIILPIAQLKDGTAQLTFQVPDAITTYSLYLFGANERQFAETCVPIVVKNAIYGQITNPSAITLNDRIELAINMQNTTDTPETVQISIPTLTNITMDGQITWTMTIPPHSVQTSSWQVKGSNVGYAQAIVEIHGDRIHEIIGFDQALYIKPPNEPVITTQNGMLDTQHPTLELTLTTNGDEAYTLGILNILPALESTVIDGLEALIQYPHGCCEQTCASTLPNVIVFEYLEARQQLTPQLRDKLLGHMRAGYDMLLRYHNADGGFSYWGGSSSPFYTALAIGVIARLSMYITIDSTIITNAYAYLKTYTDKDGGWRSSRFQGHSSIAPVNLPDLTLSAYILHSLASAKIIDLDTFQWITAHADFQKHPVVMGMILEAWAKCPEYQEKWKTLPTECRKILLTTKSVLPDGIGWSDNSTLTRSSDPVDVEATAQVLLGLHATFPNDPDLLSIFEDGIKLLLTKRGTRGWRTTRDTLIASTAITQISRADKPNFVLTIHVNGSEICKETITPENVSWKAFALREIFIEHLQVQNTIQIHMEGTGRCHVVADLKKWYLTPSQQRILPLDITRHVSVVKDVDMILTLTPQEPVSSVMLEEPIPALIQCINLDELAKQCDHVEIKNNVLCIFFNRLTTLTTMHIRFTKIRSGNCMLEALRAYEMYNPTHYVLLAPEHLML